MQSFVIYCPTSLCEFCFLSKSKLFPRRGLWLQHAVRQDDVLQRDQDRLHQGRVLCDPGKWLGHPLNCARKDIYILSYKLIPTIVPRHSVHKYLPSVIIFCLWQNIKLCKKFPGLKSRNVIMRISKLPCLMRIRKMKSVSTAELTMRKVTKRKCHRQALRIVITTARSQFLQKKHPARQFRRLLKWTISRTRKYSWEKAHWPPSVHPQLRWTHPNIKIESVPSGEKIMFVE